VRNAWNTVLKAREKHTQETKSERSDEVRGIVDIETPRMIANKLTNELVIVLNPCQSDVQLYRPTSVVEITTIIIDMIRNIHSSKESILKMLLHLGYLTEHGTYQRTLTTL